MDVASRHRRIPAHDPRHVGSQHRYTYGVMPTASRAGTWQTGKHDTFSYGPDTWSEEPVFTPRQGATDETDGWLMATVLNYRPRAHRTCGLRRKARVGWPGRETSLPLRATARLPRGVCSSVGGRTYIRVSKYRPGVVWNVSPNAATNAARAAIARRRGNLLSPAHPARAAAALRETAPAAATARTPIRSRPRTAAPRSARPARSAARSPHSPRCRARKPPPPAATHRSWAQANPSAGTDCVRKQSTISVAVACCTASRRSSMPSSHARKIKARNNGDTETTQLAAGRSLQSDGRK